VLLPLHELDHDTFRPANESESQTGVADQWTDSDLGARGTQLLHRGINVVDRQTRYAPARNEERAAPTATIRSYFGRPGDREDLYRGEGRAAQGPGASDVINYAETPNWNEQAHELTNGRGVDCVVEIGGPGTIAMSLRALAVGGHVSLIGASLSPSGTGLDPLLLTGRGISVGSISVGSRTDFEAMNRAIAFHRLLPLIDRTFPFAEAKEAYRFFEGRGHFGKVVIRLG
jgi:hypothetical protein